MIGQRHDRRRLSKEQREIFLAETSETRKISRSTPPFFGNFGTVRR